MARKKQDQSSNKESRSNPKKPAASKSRKTSTGNKRGQGRDFPVIGVGPSAGGLEAFAKFFSAMPTDTGMAFVLVQHHGGPAPPPNEDAGNPGHGQHEAGVGLEPRTF